MLTLVLYALLAVVVMAVVFFVVASVLPAGEQIAPSIRDERPWELPAGHAVLAEEIAAVRLPVALRGYRFAETDVLLDRLAEELRARDELIARLRQPIAPLGADAAATGAGATGAGATGAGASEQSAGADEPADTQGDDSANAE